jgi:glycosyltransferase involved in cell wall biosynthesis
MSRFANLMNMTRTSGATSYRIGIDARFYRTTTGGIGRYTQQLLRHLFQVDRQNQYTVFITPDDVPDWNIDLPHVSVVVTPVKHYTPAEQTAFFRMLLAMNLDLVHFLNVNHPVLYRRPFVVTLHDLTIITHPETTRSKSGVAKRKAYEYMVKRGLRAAKRVIAVTEHTAHDAEAMVKLPHARMEVIPHGVAPAQVIEFGSKCMVYDFLGTKQPYILFVSQWRAHKGILTLVEAFERFKEMHPESGHVLVLTGDQASAPASLRDRVASSPAVADIIAPGFVPDELLPALYAHATVFVMPSEYEGFGMPALEAMSYGCPVILANNSSQPEVGGKAARYFATRDAVGLAEQLEIVMGDAGVREQMIAAGYQQIKKFDWTKTAERTLQVYLSILERRR